MWQFIYESKNNKFSILFDTETGSLEFCYWRQYAGNRFLKEGEEFEAERDNRNFNRIERGLLISEDSYNEHGCLPIVENHKHPSKVKIIKDSFVWDIQSEVEKNRNKILIFMDCSFDKDVVVSDDNGSKCDAELAFLNCTFEKNFDLRGLFTSSIWIVDCNIKSHFSLKKSRILGDVHMESNCFDGSGGVSFRGVKAENLYVDFNTIGSEDMFWFNEMNISGIVSIGGIFKSKIQILSNQDHAEYIDDTEIGKIDKLFIGMEYSDKGADEDNHTVTENSIEIRGLNVNSINMSNLDAKSITISHVKCSNNIYLKDISTDKDLEIKNIVIKAGNLRIDKSSIGRHLFIQYNDLPYLTSLSGTSVSEVSYIEKNDFKPSTSNINFSRFTTSRLLFNPAYDLYANKKNNLLKFRPPEFSLLLKDAKDLGDQYCSLKHWLSDSGKLKEEDMAYFHMNDSFSSNAAYTAIFGTIFGWGVRLTNILMSSLFIMVIFFCIYMLIGMTAITSLTVAIQSFFGVLADPIFETTELWRTEVPSLPTTEDSSLPTTEYKEGGLFFKDLDFTHKINWWITAESVLGIFFITVLVGAYVRKMLR
jgi:hypothetical protein